MSSEEINEVLEELHEVDVDKLDGRAKRLFDAIMKIADERDELKLLIEEAIPELEGVQKWLKDYPFEGYYPTLSHLIKKMKGKK